MEAQQFGGFSPSTKWMQINTDTARIIFTKDAKQQAYRIATLIHKAAADTPFAIGNKLRKINIILQSHTTLANGYVALAPYRSEYYLIPGSNVFDFGNLPWYENLAVHEYRHVQQYNNFRNGLSKGFYYLFGEQGLALGNAMSVPDWFFEGDAVHSETALTTQGRGRQPLFLSAYNSLWLGGKNYSWMKLRNGSFKDYVPDHYYLGYLLVNYGYLKYGDDFWKNVTHDASAFKGLFYPFQKAIKKYTGVNYKTFRNEAFNYYQQKLGNVTEQNVPKNRTVTRYYFPQYIGPDSLLYLKTAYNKLTAFYIRDNKGEHKLELQSISSEEWFSYRHRKIVYTAYSTNPRWSLTDYSDIVVYDMDSHKERRLTHKAKYYTPDLSPSGKNIVAIKFNDSLQTELQILNASNGLVIKSVLITYKGAPEGIYFSNPKFIDEDRIVVGTRKTNSQMALQVYNINSGEWEQLLTYSYNTIGQPFVNGNTIYFTANFNANDDIYALRLKGKKLFQLTRDFTGNYYPSTINDTLVWSHFTAEGYALEKEALNKLAWGEINLLNVQERAILYPVALEHNISSIPTREFTTKPYSKSTGLLHFHSWSPYYVDPEFTFSLFSDNILNTFSNQIYYRYNQNETSNAIGWNALYGRLFAELNAGLEYTYHRTVQTVSSTQTMDQFEATVGYNIPLNFTKNKTYKFLNFGSNYVFNRTMPVGTYKDSLSAGNTTYLSHFITWAHYLPMAYQHIYPRFGYTISLNHRHRLEESGYQFFANSQLFLPSIANHSIVVTGSFQQTDTSDIFFSNRFANSRGYPDYYFSKMWKIGANYHFPIAYPDFGIANIVYLNRLRGNVFYDFTKVYSNDKTRSKNMRSTGAELYFDTRWWNQQPVSFGIRYSYLLDNDWVGVNKSSIEFIIPMDLIQY